MKEKALKFWQKVQSDFKSFSVGQKAATIAAVLALVVGGFLFSTWKSKPQYAPLFTNLAPADASAIIDKLNAAHTPYQLGSDGTSINVPKDKVYSACIAMSRGRPAELQPAGRYDLLDQEGVTTSEFKQQVDYQRAVEGELAKTIKAINGINAASVHLAIPTQDVFNDGSQKPTASVLLTTGGTTQLSQEQVQSIAYLVSSAVPNMAVNDVTITDQHGATLAAQGEDFAGAAGSDTQTTATTAYNDRIKSALQDMIDAVVCGVGHAKVLYNATLDFNKQDTTSEQYVYSSGVPPLSEETSSEKYNGNQAGTGGILGSSPTPTAAAVPGNGSGNYSKQDTTKNNAVGKVTQTVQTAPGSVKQQSVSVVLDAAAKNVNVPAMQALVTSAIGLNGTRGDTLTVQSLNFDTAQATAQSAADAAAAKVAAAAAAKAKQQAMIKQLAIAGVALIALIVFWIMRRRRKLIEPPAEEFGWYDDPYLPVAPEVQHVEEEDLAGELNEAQARRRALVTLASEQPDDVARVLSNWLNA